MDLTLPQADAPRTVVAVPWQRGACVVGPSTEWVLVTTPQGGWCLVEGTCRHRGGPLRLGTCDGHAVRCPWHGTAFSWKALIRRAAPAVRVGGLVKVVVPEVPARVTRRRVELELEDTPPRARDAARGSTRRRTAVHSPAPVPA